MPGTQRLRLLRRGIVIGVCVLSASVPMHGQRPAPFIGVSSSASPPVSDRRVLRQQRVDVDSLARLSDVQASSVLQLDFFSDVTFRAVRERVERTAAGVAWTGSLDGYPQSQAVFVTAGDELIGHVYAPFGFFRVERQAGSYVVQQVAQPEFDGSDLVEAPRTGRGGAVTISRPSAVDDEHVIDVLVAYTNNALKGFGSAIRAQAAVDLAIAETNQALRNTGVEASVRVVHLVAVEYEESGDHRTDLARLLDPGDGFLDAVVPLREEHAADLVALITERMDEACGAAYMAYQPSSPTFGWLSVNRRICLNDNPTLAHEIGHNLGGAHDWYDTPDGGAYVHAKGHVSIPARFRDIMSTYHHCYDANVSCARFLSYSNPALRHQGHAQGVSIGTNTKCTARNPSNDPCDADLAHTFSNVAPLVAKYRDSRTALSARRLLPGGSFRSPDGRYRLTYQADGNLVLNDDENRIPVWATHTAGRTAGQALLQTDGNFVVSGPNGDVHWSSGTAGNPGAYLALQNDGNLVIYRADGRPVWGRD